MTAVESAAPAIPQDASRLGPDDRFTFRCDPTVDCFGKCCHDVSIALTPYDVLRMKKARGTNSSDFLDRHTSVAYSTETNVPVVFLKMDDETKQCSLLGAKGCEVYAHRPWACRMYPLGMAEPADPRQSAQRFYFVVKEELCHGHGKDGECALREFMQNQGVEPYDVAQHSFRKLLAVAAQRKQPLSSDQCAMYYMALYDADRFRRFVFETRFLEMFDIDESVVEEVRTDDEELLELAIKWLAFSLFQQCSMRLSKAAKQKHAANASAPSQVGASAS
jgi:hypothetical protein